MSLQAATPLTSAEECALARAAQRGDLEARNRLVVANLGFAAQQARALSAVSSVPFEDLQQEAALGLMRAVEKFDPGRDLRFLTYAAHWVRAFTLRYIERRRSCVSRHGAPMDLSLDAPVGDEDDSDSHLDMVVYPGRSAEDELIDVEHRRVVRAVLHRFRGRLQGLDGDIVAQRLMTDTPATLEECGAAHGVSREQARQRQIVVEKLLIKKLGPVSNDCDDAALKEIGMTTTDLQQAPAPIEPPTSAPLCLGGCGRPRRSNFREGKCGFCHDREQKASRKPCAKCGAMFNGDGTICHRHSAAAKGGAAVQARRSAAVAQVAQIPAQTFSPSALTFEQLVECVAEFKRRAKALVAKLG